jgi:hypothetical protein
MRKTISCMALFIFLIGLNSAVSFSQEANLIGTWEGSTIIPDMGENIVTMVITKEEGELAIEMTDSFEMLSDTECEDIEFKEGTLTFHFSLTQDLETQTIWITLELEGDTLNGYWENDGGEQGGIELKKI